MVRVFYEPPPYGPRTSINRSRNGPRGGGLFGKLGERLQKMHPTMPMVVGVAISCAICYIPLLNPKLPFSMEPEYQAAQMAYMRYHNMNPIFGISSKKARATES